MACNHRWRKLYEEMLLGLGQNLCGWECVDCGEFVASTSLTPSGISGTVLEKAARLVGPHGGCSYCSDGSVYKEQIIDENGELTIIRSDKE